MQFLLSLFYRFIVRDVRVNWVRTLLTVCGIALGVSVYLAISIANGTALTKFSQTVDRISGKANIELMSLSGLGVKQDILRDLTSFAPLGVKYTPVIDEHVVIAGTGAHAAVRDADMVQLVGIDMLADPDFKSYQESSGDAGKDSKSENEFNSASGGSGSRALSVFLPRCVLVGSKIAARHGFKVGDTFAILVSDKREGGHRRRLQRQLDSGRYRPGSGYYALDRQS
jgi:ABC-type lipoprotein release transport system permease subunit